MQLTHAPTGQCVRCLSLAVSQVANRKKLAGVRYRQPCLGGSTDNAWQLVHLTLQRAMSVCVVQLVHLDTAESHERLGMVPTRGDGGRHDADTLKIGLSHCGSC